ncbi:MAG TPA: hypothetical protein VND96_13255 [Candidatus Micrarchaeaceae archaeon]|nr:hypothetical protein [Candidatus Micrarchaeaceae archaeon]
MGTSRGHRLQVSFTEAQRAAIAERARGAGLSLSATVRKLVSAGLSLDSVAVGSSDSPAALAALTAAEHAVLMVASVLPEGERRMRSLAERAGVAAEERLALFRSSIEEEQV